MAWQPQTCFQQDCSSQLKVDSRKCDTMSEQGKTRVRSGSLHVTFSLKQPDFATVCKNFKSGHSKWTTSVKNANHVTSHSTKKITDFLMHSHTLWLFLSLTQGCQTQLMWTKLWIIIQMRSLFTWCSSCFPSLQHNLAVWATLPYKSTIKKKK